MIEKLVDRVYEQNKHKAIRKRKVEKLLFFLRFDCLYQTPELELCYNNSGLEGLLYLAELEKSSRNMKNI